MPLQYEQKRLVVIIIVIHSRLIIGNNYNAVGLIGVFQNFIHKFIQVMGVYQYPSKL